jgi:predicted metal-dependent phosphotriesterase family hydrolase
VSGFIRVLGGEMPADEAGVVYAHEHLIIDSPLVAHRWPHIHLPSVDEGAEEVCTCVRAGVRTMVDAMPAGSGRDPERLARISILTGIRIVACTGLHTSKYYEGVEWAQTESAERLAQRFVADIEIGIDRHDYLGPEPDRTDVRAGIVKAGSLTEELTDRDRRLFQAVAITSATTGVPVLTHTEGGRGGMYQIRELLDLGVEPERIALSHTDKVQDVGYHAEMLATGVYLCYDQALRWPEGNQTAWLIGEMVAAGFGERLLVGTDGARRSLWKTLGGAPGLAWLRTGLPALLADRGLGVVDVDRLYVDNPARYLSLEGRVG